MDLSRLPDRSVVPRYNDGGHAGYDSPGQSRRAGPGPSASQSPFHNTQNVEALSGLRPYDDTSLPEVDLSDVLLRTDAWRRYLRAREDRGY